MQGHIKRNRCLAFMLTLLLAMSSVFFGSASAHEMYYDGYAPGWNPISLKWADVTNRVAYLKVNGDYLSSDYTSHYTIARDAWDNASARVVTSQTSRTSSNVDLSTATEAAWNKLWGDSAPYVLGYCNIVTTDGVNVESAATAANSSGKIRYAGILLTPFNPYSNVTHRRYTMIHEIGHALGLGHPNAQYYPSFEDSVMRTNVIESYYTPRTHDKNDLESKY